MERVNGYSRILATGAPFPNATITVFNTGTLVLASIFADNLPVPTPKANPFLAGADGFFFFYAVNGRYDIAFTAGADVYTWGDTVFAAFQSLNGQPGEIQTFATASTGVDFAISSAANVHTFAIPSASATARGLVTTGTQTFAGVKTFLTPIAIDSGGTALSATPTNGQLLIGNGAGYTLSTLTGTTNQVVVTNGLGSITLSLPQNIATGSSPTFSGINLTTANVSTLTQNGALYSGVSGLIASTAALADGQLAIGRTGNTPVAANLTAGSGISIVNAAGAITVSVVSAGITSLNGLTPAAQTFSVGTTGTDFAIVSSGSNHAFNLPDASASARGVVTTGTQTFAGVKTFTGHPIFEPGTSTGVLSKTSGVFFTDVTDHLIPTGTTDGVMTNTTIPANVLDTNGKALRVKFMGSTASTGGGLKTYELNVGGTQIAAISSVAAVTWIAEFFIIRIDSDSVDVAAWGAVAAGSFALASATRVNALNFTAAITLQSLATTAATSSVTQTSFIMESVG